VITIIFGLNVKICTFFKASRKSGKEVTSANAENIDKDSCPIKGGGGTATKGNDARKEGFLEINKPLIEFLFYKFSNAMTSYWKSQNYCDNGSATKDDFARMTKVGRSVRNSTIMASPNQIIIILLRPAEAAAGDGVDLQAVN
jgi:hypothetical protein